MNAADALRELKGAIRAATDTAAKRFTADTGLAVNRVRIEFLDTATYSNPARFIGNVEVEIGGME